MNLPLWGMTLLWLLPLLGAVLVRPRHDPNRVRRFTVALLAVVFTLALGFFLLDGTRNAFALSEAQWVPVSFLGLRYHLGVDGLTAVLLPLTSGLGVLVALGAPRAEISGRSAARMLVGTAGALGTLLSLDGLLLCVFYVVSLWPVRIRREQGLPEVLLALGSSLPLLLGMLLLGLLGWRRGLDYPFDLVLLNQLAGTAQGGLHLWAGGLMILGVLVRLGIFPFHLWGPSLFAEEEPGRAPVVLCAMGTPLATFLMARLCLPLFGDLCQRLAPAFLLLGLLSAAYGALLSLSQRDLRRILGHVLNSQSGLLLSGMAALNQAGVSGALLHAIAARMSLMGLLLWCLLLRARTGTTDVRRLGGLVQEAPELTTGFFLLSAAVVGFPGTMAFVSLDLLEQGLLRRFGGWAGAMPLLLMALCGITLFHAYVRAFLGKGGMHRDPALRVRDLLLRERLVGVLLVGALLLGGFLSAPLLAVRHTAVDALGSTGEH